MAKKLVRVQAFKTFTMKKILAVAIIGGLMACNSGSDSGRGDEQQHNVGTRDEVINNTGAAETSIGDTTPTTNNNIYNTDSATGRGTAYDTAARRGSK